jgi:hypothetical protein
MAMRGLSILMAMAVIAACFFPWVIIENRDIYFGGFDSTNQNFGKPGLLHVVLCSIVIVLLLIGRIWSIRIAFIFCALNIAWALRNYVIISACRGGECPQKQPALYIILFSSLLLALFLLFIRPKSKQLSQVSGNQIL